MNDPINPTNGPANGREFDRKDVLFAAHLVVGEDKIDCEIINISFGGTQVRASRTLKPKTKVSLEIDPFGTFAMEVRWCRKPDAGLRFKEDSEKVAELVMAIATYA